MKKIFIILILPLLPLLISCTNSIADFEIIHRVAWFSKIPGMEFLNETDYWHGEPITLFEQKDIGFFVNDTVKFQQLSEQIPVLDSELSSYIGEYALIVVGFILPGGFYPILDIQIRRSTVFITHNYRLLGTDTRFSVIYVIRVKVESTDGTISRVLDSDGKTHRVDANNRVRGEIFWDR